MNKYLGKLHLRMLGLPLLGLCMLYLTGCATSISEVTMSLPTTVGQRAQEDPHKTFYVNSVVDDRVFDLHPSDPSVPSLDPNQYDRSRAVGRKRNSYGKALGGFLLKEGQTVEFMVKEAVHLAAADNGYRVLHSKEEVKADTVVADVRITRFWTWVNMGFWTIKLNTHIRTDVDLRTANGSQSLQGEGIAELNTMFGKENNFLIVMNDAYNRFYVDLRGKLSATLETWQNDGSGKSGGGRQIGKTGRRAQTGKAE